MASGYKPSPLDLSHIKLTQQMEDLVEKLADNAHNVWARERVKQGWTYGVNLVRWQLAKCLIFVEYVTHPKLCFFTVVYAKDTRLHLLYSVAFFLNFISLIKWFVCALTVRNDLSLLVAQIDYAEM